MPAGWFPGGVGAQILLREAASRKPHGPQARRDRGHGSFLMRKGAVCRELVATARHDGVDVFPVGTQDTADLGRRGPLGEPRDHFRDLVPLFAPT